MSDLMQGSSEYAVGNIDTATTLVNGVSSRAAEHVNGPAAGVVQIEQVLGSGLTLKGSTADLSARLGVALGADGRVSLADAPLNGTLNVVHGGLGIPNVPSGKTLIGNDTSPMTAGTGLVFHGPTAFGTGSTMSHEGIVTISASQALSGIHFYTDFTLNAAQTITVASGSQRLVIMASRSIVINGTINTSGGGSAGGGAGASGGHPGTAGSDGFSQPAGGGGGSDTDVGARGGHALLHGVTMQSGGTAGATAGAGGGATTQVSTEFIIDYPFAVVGGAGGGGGAGATVPSVAGAAGGRGGGSLVLIAPSITLGAASTLRTTGSAGGNTTGNGGCGGGGGAGNIYMYCRTFTDSGCTYNQAGGAAGTGSNNAGGVGAAGTKQIFIYG